MELTAALFDLCSSVQRPIIAIDGPAGAGKTTLAEHLAAALSLKYKCATIHMDDLYNGWSTPFDHHLEDALTKACTSHRKSEKYSLSFFNWSKSEYWAAVEIPQSELLILEGVGASQAVIRPYLSASIWIDIDRDLGLERVIARDGESISTNMQNWLGKQEQHFIENKTQMSSDFELTHP
ncbi:Udk Uridine kinase [Candidatus Nanopelagicaceae bacterium]